VRRPNPRKGLVQRAAASLLQAAAFGWRTAPSHQLMGDLRAICLKKGFAVY